MEQAGLTAGQAVRANLWGVHIIYGGELFFCPMEGIEIVSEIASGNGGELPEDVTMQGEAVLMHIIPGYYNVYNAELSSSDDELRLIVHPDTAFERAAC